MSAHHHDDHQSTEQKPVSFTVPFILACVTLLITLCFLSLCNPKKGHHGECNHEGKECSKECAAACEKDGHGKECAGHEEKAGEAAATEETAAVPAGDSAARATEPAAEAKVEEAHH